MKEALLQLKELIHSYDGKKVLDIPELTVKEGEILTILGPTGSGKSTLLRLVNLLERPEQGTLFWRSSQINGSSRFAIRRKMAMVFQDPFLFSSTVYKNVAYGLRLRHFSKVMIDEEVSRTLKLFSLEHLASRDARSLSGGEAQRASFARALVTKPELLLLDEPFASLDPLSKNRLMEDVLGILKDLKVTTIHVTHDQSEAFRMADRIGILDGGEILQIGTPEEVFYRPVSAQVASFVGTETLLSGSVIAQNEGLATINVDGKEIEAVSSFRVGDKVTACIRPEEIIILKEQGGQQLAVRGQGSARNHFPGKVKKIESIGPIAKVSLDCGFPLVAAITRRSALDLGLERGEDVVASFKATAVHTIGGSRVKGQGSSDD